MKNLLVAVDNSPRAGMVLEAAIKFAEKLDAKLSLLRAIPWPTELPSHAYPLTPADFETVALRLATEELERLSQAIPAQHFQTFLVRFGTPWKEICDVAKELDVDMIIIGAHGYTLFERILGTTASRVSNHCDRTVLLVRDPERLVDPARL